MMPGLFLAYFFKMMNPAGAWGWSLFCFGADAWSWSLFCFGADAWSWSLFVSVPVPGSISIFCWHRPRQIEICRNFFTNNSTQAQPISENAIFGIWTGTFHQNSEYSSTPPARAVHARRCPFIICSFIFQKRFMICTRFLHDYCI